MKKHGRLVCSACGFDFSKRYGDFGANFIDALNTKPVHTMEPGEMAKVADLLLRCSNYHRVVHSRRRWLSVERANAAFANASTPG